MKPRIFSGIQPSGNLHIGNYLGAIKQWVEMQEKFDAIFCIVDLHAITVPQDPETLRKYTIEIAKMYLAAGIDPKKATLFVQSEVKEHTELAWILNTVARMGDLEKMTQFKDKSELSFLKGDMERFLKSSIESMHSESKKNDKLYSEVDESIKRLKSLIEKENSEENLSQILFDLVVREGNFRKQYSESMQKLSKIFIDHMAKEDSYKGKLETIGVGLFDYPVLMAADILLYDTAVVPVGDDQLQHVELARTLARRFNRQFGETFVIPEAKIQKEGARIMGLDNPTKKMSKSATSEYNYVALLDESEVARKKIMKAVTDSGTDIVYADDKPALKNLINIYSLLGNIPTKDVVEKFHGKGYADFKRDLADVAADFLVDFQRKFRALSDEEALRILGEGAKRARAIASEKMKVIRERVGFLS